LARSDNGDDQIWKDIVEEVCKDADRLFKIIGEAYAVLSDPAKVFSAFSSDKLLESIYFFIIPFWQRSQFDSEEEIRNSQKKHQGNSMTRNNVMDQTDNRRHWKGSWRSFGNSSFKDSEAGRSSRQKENQS